MKSKNPSLHLCEYGIVDIHSHILPGIDDGAASITEAANVLRGAFDSGTSHIIATPHYITGSFENDSKSVLEQCRRLGRLITNENIRISVHPGCEVFLSPEIVELYESGDICTLNDSCYMLIELPMHVVPIYTEDVLYKLQLKGIIPIIAHPERNSEVLHDQSILEDMVRRGILVQVNSGSITGRYGRRVRNLVFSLIKRGLVHFVASDTHCQGSYTSIIDAVNIVTRKFGADSANSLFSINGRLVLENGMVPV